MTISISEIKNFLEDSEKNYFEFTLEKSEDNKVEISISEVYNFTIEQKNGKFSVSTEEETLSGDWLKEVNNYSTTSISSLLQKCTDVYANIEEDDGDDLDDDDLDEEELNNNNDDDDDDEIDEELLKKIHGDDHLINNNPEEKDLRSPSYDPELEQQLKKKFGLHTNIKKPSSSSTTSTTTTTHSQTAINRLMKDYITMCKHDTSQFGFKAQPIGNNMFVWEVKFFNFDEKGEPEEKALQNDLKQYNSQYKQDYFLFEMRFPSDYPFKPPFIRAVKPRFKFHTGRVTIGGSICNQLLTLTGWSPNNSIESILIQIRAGFIEGKGRIDFAKINPYTMNEAKDAFFRVAKQHGWMDQPYHIE